MSTENGDVSASSFFESFEENTSKLSTGGAARMPRKEVTFVIDHETLGAGAFKADFRVTLSGLTSGHEVAAARGANTDPFAMAAAMAKLAISKIDGKPANAAHREYLWEVLGPDGRNLVMSVYSNMMSPSEQAKKKAEESMQLG